MCKCWCVMCSYWHIYLYSQVCWALQIAGRFLVFCQGLADVTVHLQVFQSQLLLEAQLFWEFWQVGGGMVQHFLDIFIACVYISLYFYVTWLWFQSDKCCCCHRSIPNFMNLQSSRSFSLGKPSQGWTNRCTASGGPKHAIFHEDGDREWWNHWWWTAKLSVGRLHP